VPPTYDPAEWDEEVNSVMMRYWANQIPPDKAAAMDAEMARVNARWLEAAKAAFPATDVWYEDTANSQDFAAQLESRMSDEDARTIRSLRTGSPEHTWRAIAEWAYQNRSQTWRIGWTMPGHQEVGELICRAAAARLDEDAYAEPWN